jgi:hypothetical protein
VLPPRPRVCELGVADSWKSTTVSVESGFVLRDAVPNVPVTPTSRVPPEFDETVREEVPGH